MFFGKSLVVSGNQSYLKRVRIHNLLEQAVKKPAVTVIAGTGFGKTQAVYSFLQDYSAITYWQQITSLDNICERFWKNLVNMIFSHSPKAALEIEAIGFPDTPSKIDMVVAFLAGVAKTGKKHVVVFDDFHLIAEKKILTLTESIINACIPNICVILISRNEPEINLTDLLVKDMVSNINENDLRFSKNEMELYFEMRGIRVSLQTMSKIYDNTSGWIFAIRLVELAIKQGAPREEYAIDAMKINVFKLMEIKFASDVSKEAQLFLIKLSLFQSLPSELVKVLAANDERLINEALKLNSFIRYDSFANIYCIHHLFLTFLRQKQGMLNRSEKNECYHSAADWYAANSFRIDAINYYGQTGDYESILDIALTFPYAFAKEVAVLLLDILAKAPEDAFERQPLLTVLHARVLASIDRAEEAIAELNTLKKKYETLPRTQKKRSVLCEIYIVKAFISYFACIFTNDFNFSRLFMKAFKHMPQGSAVLKGKNNNQSLGAYVCRVGSEKKEDMEEYITALTASIPYASKVIYGQMYGLDDLARAELYYFKNQMKSAGSFAYSALHKAGRHGQYEIESRALFYLLRIALSSGDYAKAEDILRQIDVQSETRFPNNKMWHDIVIGWFYFTVGCGEKASGWLKSNFVKVNFAPLLSGIENLAKIKYYLSEKNYHTLLAFIENKENISGIDSFLFGKIALCVNRAVCLYHVGRLNEAASSLQQAYNLAEPNSLTMHFVELGNDMVALAKFVLKNKACTIPDDWLLNIYRKSSAYAKKVSHIASEFKKANQLKSSLPVNLTRKELEFLTDLCQGMSAAEIATNHDISKNYVNNRLQTVYSKLGAQNLKDAIHIATLLGLVT